MRPVKVLELYWTYQLKRIASIVFYCKHKLIYSYIQNLIKFLKIELQTYSFKVGCEPLMNTTPFESWILFWAGRNLTVKHVILFVIGSIKKNKKKQQMKDGNGLKSEPKWWSLELIFSYVDWIPLKDHPWIYPGDRRKREKNTCMHPRKTRVRVYFAHFFMSYRN